MGDQTRVIIKDLKKPVSGTEYGSKTLLDVSNYIESLEPSQVSFSHLANTATVATTTSYEMNVNGSLTPVDFFFENQTSTVFHMSIVNFLLVDGNIDPKDFGGINNGITNGLIISLNDTNAATLIDFTNSQPIRTNSEFGFLAGGGMVREIGTGDDSLNVNWDLSRIGGHIRLRQGQRFTITVQDDLSGVPSFRVNLQGHYEVE